MIPTRRTALALGVAALLFLVVPPLLVLFVLVAVTAAALADAWSVRTKPVVSGERPHIIARGIPVSLTLRVEGVPAKRARVRQAVPPGLVVAPSEGDGELACVLVARRRGRHVLPPPSVRLIGPFGLGAWMHNRCGDEEDVIVFPDVVTARNIAQAVRRGRFSEEGRLTRGPLGLGTDFESIRDYVPDDDVRQVNWRATARLGRPMSNQFRVEQDRDVICVIDCGRLMAAPLHDRTRLDAAVDAAAAVAMVSDVAGDRCGVVAFDGELRRELLPRRRGSDAVIRAIFDLEPVSTESDYELAFQRIRSAKRALVFLFTDLLERSAAAPLVEAMPLIARTHHVVVAGATDPDIDRYASRSPDQPVEVFETSVALEVLGSRAAAAAHIRSMAAEVIEATPDRLPAACVSAYLRAKARARV